MENPTKQTNADYKKIMNSKSVQEMKELINSQKVKVIQTTIEEEINKYKWNKK